MIKYKTKLMIKSAKKDGWQFGSIDAKSEGGDQILISYMDELAVGVDVWQLDSDGNEISVPDGTYSGGGKKITIENSKVTAIEDIQDEPQVEFAETETEPETETEKIEYVTKTEFSEFVTHVDDALSEINEKLQNFSVQTEKFANELNNALTKSTAQFQKHNKISENKKDFQLFG